jgi:hypothetical protein
MIPSISSYFKFPVRSEPSVCVPGLRCDHCRAELGLHPHRYWHMRFCSIACMTAYQQRLAEETKVKISRLDVIECG